jgi:glycosyltransferase involved in cell wall biosynthesis
MLSESRQPELTVLLPCLNEASTVGACVQVARSALAQHDIHGEVLVVDNGSTDSSASLARAAGARVEVAPRRGYGAALLAGLSCARGTFVLMADADGSYDLSRPLVFLEPLRRGKLLVVGNRFRGGVAPGAMPVLNRWLGNPALSMLGRLLFPSDVRDFHCGIRAVHRQAALGLGLRSPGMEFASELVARAVAAGWPVAEVPTTLAPDGRGRPSHLRPWRDGARHVRLLVQVWAERHAPGERKE